MLRKLFTGKLLALYLSLLIIGFFIGYDYSIITSTDTDTTDASPRQTDTVLEEKSGDPEEVNQYEE